MTVFSGIGRFFKEHIFSHFHVRFMLILVTLLCAGALSYQYFIREDSVSPAMIAGSVIVPLQEGVNGIGGFLFRTEEQRKNLKETRELLEQAREEIRSLKMENEELSGVRIENEELRSLLNARERLGDYSTIMASVIGNDGINCFERFTINRGTLDGVRVNMNVVNEDGLIGIVTRTGLNFSVVTSIIEDGMSVSAMTKNGHENCIVTGDLRESGEDILLFGNARADVDFSRDSALVTSDISDRFMPGLLIGYVQDYKTDPGDLTISGHLSPAVDFTRIRPVLVITDLREELKETEAGK